MLKKVATPKYLLQAMKSFIRTISETIYLVCLRSGNNCTILFAERVIITCCCLWSAGSFIFHYDNGAINYLLVSAVVFDLGSQHIFSKSLHGEITAMPVGFTLLSLNVVSCFFANKDRQACMLKVRKFAIAICGFIGNTLLGSLGAEIAGLRAIFLPALGFLQLFLKELTQKAVLSSYIIPENS